MKPTLAFLLRMAALTAVVLTTAAVGLSRAVPRALVVRVSAPPRYVGVNGRAFDPPTPDNYLLDTETGRLSRLGPFRGTTVDNATCSPWHDGRGGYDIIGRAFLRTGQSTEMLCEGLGVARFTTRAGSEAERLDLNPSVTGRPCWLPQWPPRVIFPTGSGDLRVQEFPDADAGTGSGPEAAEPQTITWACPIPGGFPVMVSDPAAPPIAALGGRLVVTLRAFRQAVPQVLCSEAQVWWLKLDASDRKVVAAGRLSEPAGIGDERLPAVGLGPDGRPVLAYLVCESGRGEWRLKLAPVTTAPGTGDPCVAPSETHDLGPGFAVSGPAFSADGRWLYAVPRYQSPGDPVPRISVTDVLRGPCLAPRSSLAAR